MTHFEHTTLGQVETDDNGGLRVRGLHHPKRDDHRPEFEVVIEGDLTLDASDPTQRAQLQAIVEALQTAIAHGECVGWMGVPASQVRITPSGVEWDVTAPGRTMKVREGR